MYRACPPKRVPWANSTPSAPGEGMSIRAPITNERFLTLTACHSGTGEASGR